MHHETWVDCDRRASLRVLTEELVYQVWTVLSQIENINAMVEF